MAVIIDRRLNPSGKNHINRQRFLERSKKQIKDAVKNSVSNKDIKDIGNGENIKVRPKDISEPTFHNDHQTGTHRRVLPGNKEFDEGDYVPKPQRGGGQGGGKAGKGEGQDDFEFTLTREEFLEYLFEDLELPDFVKQTMKVTHANKFQKAGFTNTGTPANLSIVRTFKNSIGRRLALTRPSDEEIEELKEEIALAEKEGEVGKAIELTAKLEELEARKRRVPFIEENDLRYTYYSPKPQPTSQAVMFCLMDVSGSMGEFEKDIAKRFFLLLYLFLEMKYDKIDIKFIRHTEVAEEVDEQTFFYDRKSGGTLISSGLELIRDTIKSRYPVQDWNIYIAQCTDGDNWVGDNEVCEDIIVNQLLPYVQYYAYVQVREIVRHPFMGMYSDLHTAWPLYEKLSDTHENMVCKKITDQRKVWSVFKELFTPA